MMLAPCWHHLVSPRWHQCVITKCQHFAAPHHPIASIMESRRQLPGSSGAVPEASRRAEGAGTCRMAVSRAARRAPAAREDLLGSLRPATDQTSARRPLSRLAGHTAAQLGQLNAGSLDVGGRDRRARLRVRRVAPAHAGSVHPARVRIGSKDRHRARVRRAHLSKGDRHDADPRGARAPASSPSVFRSSSSSGQ